MKRKSLTHLFYILAILAGMVLGLLVFNSCSTIYVYSTVSPGVQSQVKTEMVDNEKARRQRNRKVEKAHNQHRRYIQRQQRKDWK